MEKEQHLSSTKQDWTPEPWQTGREDGQSYHGHSGEPFSSIYRQDDDERMPLTPDGFGGLTRVPLRIAYIEGKDVPRKEEKANARRIVACVNALATIPDPAAYIKAAKDLHEAAEAYYRHPLSVPRHAYAKWSALGDAIAALRTLSTPESEVK